ncbi:hypothetical protein VTL71DRAFT_204 [Oculimacula yallundae]|uniref:Uncharacterized protein n=1 Tax=Oculimacula yallundae TaxID=86028 RepID=A0ABR4D0H1_9HELO
MVSIDTAVALAFGLLSSILGLVAILIGYLTLRIVYLVLYLALVTLSVGLYGPLEKSPIEELGHGKKVLAKK